MFSSSPVHYFCQLCIYKVCVSLQENCQILVRIQENRFQCINKTETKTICPLCQTSTSWGLNVQPFAKNPFQMIQHYTYIRYTDGTIPRIISDWLIKVQYGNRLIRVPAISKCWHCTLLSKISLAMWRWRRYFAETLLCPIITPQLIRNLMRKREKYNRSCYTIKTSVENNFLLISLKMVISEGSVSACKLRRWQNSRFQLNGIKGE